MSDVVTLRRAHSLEADMAAERINGIWNAVQTVLAEVGTAQLSASDMARVLGIFDSANRCIRVVLSEFGNQPAIKEVVSRSLEIKAMIDDARAQVR